MIFILVTAFFLLGCSFNCKGMKENFSVFGDGIIWGACSACKDNCRNPYCDNYTEECKKYKLEFSSDCKLTKEEKMRKKIEKKK